MPFYLAENRTNCLNVKYVQRAFVRNSADSGARCVLRASADRFRGIHLIVWHSTEARDQGISTGQAKSVFLGPKQSQLSQIDSTSLCSPVVEGGSRFWASYHEFEQEPTLKRFINLITTYRFQLSYSSFPNFFCSIFRNFFSISFSECRQLEEFLLQTYPVWPHMSCKKWPQKNTETTQHDGQEMLTTP